MDNTAFIPVKQALADWDRPRAYKAFTKVIKANSWIQVDQTKKNRPTVHAGYWAMFRELEKHGKVDVDSLLADLPAELIDQLLAARDEVEERKAAIQQKGGK